MHDFQCSTFPDISNYSVNTAFYKPFESYPSLKVFRRQKKKKKKVEYRVSALVLDSSTEVFLPRSPNAFGSLEENLIHHTMAQPDLAQQF